MRQSSVSTFSEVKMPADENAYYSYVRNEEQQETLLFFMEEFIRLL